MDVDKIRAVFPVLLAFLADNDARITAGSVIAKRIRRFRDSIGAMSSTQTESEWNAIWLRMCEEVARANSIPADFRALGIFCLIREDIDEWRAKKTRRSGTDRLLALLDNAEEHAKVGETKQAITLLNAMKEKVSGSEPGESRLDRKMTAAILENADNILRILSSAPRALELPCEGCEVNGMFKSVLVRGSAIPVKSLKPKGKSNDATMSPSNVATLSVTSPSRSVTLDTDSESGMMRSALAKFDVEKSATRSFLEREVWKAGCAYHHPAQQEIEERCASFDDLFGITATSSFLEELRRRWRETELVRRFDAIEHELSVIDMRGRLPVPSTEGPVRDRAIAITKARSTSAGVSFLENEVMRFIRLVSTLPKSNSGCDELRARIRAQDAALTARQKAACSAAENAVKTAQTLRDRQAEHQSWCHAYDQHLLELFNARKSLVTGKAERVTIDSTDYDLDGINRKIAKVLSAKRGSVKSARRVIRGRNRLLEELASRKL